MFNKKGTDAFNQGLTLSRTFRMPLNPYVTWITQRVFSCNPFYQSVWGRRPCLEPIPQPIDALVVV
jgi:hypothetical protein